LQEQYAGQQMGLAIGKRIAQEHQQHAQQIQYSTETIAAHANTATA